jgi:hypothetical protein
VVPISVSSKSKPLLFSVAPIPEHAEFQAIDVHVQAKKGRAKKPITPAVNTSPRMKTRSQTNLQGFKAAPVTSVEKSVGRRAKKIDEVRTDVSDSETIVSVPAGHKKIRSSVSAYLVQSRSQQVLYSFCNSISFCD